MFNGNTFYFATMRKIIVAFGSLFNGVKIQRMDSDGITVKTIPVPIAYGPGSYWAKLYKRPGSNDSPVIEVTMPRLAFELYALNPMIEKATSQISNHKRVHDTDTNDFLTQLNPMPYEFNMRLSLLSINIEDALQIAEQILPYHEINVTINEIPSMDIKRDIRIKNTGVNITDDYEGDSLSSKRLLQWDFEYSISGYINKPIITKPPILNAIMNSYLSSVDRIDETIDVQVTPNTAKEDEAWDAVVTITTP